MKVILKQAVPKVGKAGQVVNVKNGFARNFLFPRGMAVIAEKGQLRALEVMNARVAAKLADTKAGAEDVASKLNGKTIDIEVKAGDGGRLFGAITSENIADAIKSAFGVNLEKKNVALIHPIKRTGKTPIEIDLHRDVDIRMTVFAFDPSQIEIPKTDAPAPVVAAPVEEAPTEEAETVEA